MKIKDKVWNWMLGWKYEVLIPLAKECLALYGRIVFGWRKIKKKFKKGN